MLVGGGEAYNLHPQIFRRFLAKYFQVPLLKLTKVWYI